MPAPRRLATISLLAALLCAARVTTAQRIGDAIGTVAERDLTVEEFFHGTVTPDALPGREVRVGSEFETGEQGRLFVNFQDRSAIKIYSRSQLQVTESLRTDAGFEFKHQLRGGEVRVLVKQGTRVTIATGTDTKRTTVSSHGTDFIVTYDGHATEVVSLSGDVDVQNHSGFARVTAGHRTVAVPGRAPSVPVEVDDATLQQYVGGGAFIGGGTLESQTIRHPLLSVDVVPPEGHVALPPPPPDEPYPRDPGPGAVLKPPFVPRGGIRIRF